MGASAEEQLQALLRRGLAGDEAAYRGFLAGLSAHLRAFVRKRLARMPDDVEDIVQESLLAVHNQRHTYDAAQPLTPWAHAIRVAPSAPAGWPLASAASWRWPPRC